MTELVHAALCALGPSPSRREVALVAGVLRDSGDEDALAVFRLGPEPVFDRDAATAVCDLAVAADVGPFTGLDLYTEMVRPGWSPFPLGGVQRPLRAVH